MTNSGIIKLAGPQWTANNSNQPSIIPTNAVAGSNAGSSANVAGGDFTGYGNATPGGATLMRVPNGTGALAVMTVSNVAVNGAFVNNIIVLQENTDYFVQKYAYDQISFANTTGGALTASVFVNPAAFTW